MGFHVLEHPGLGVPQLECQWFESIWTGLNAIGGSIECTESFLVPPARFSDVYIMDAVCDCKQFTNPQIRQINACQLYMQVILISDVATPKGSKMMTNYYNGKKLRRQNWPMIRYP
jgi:hypothetical protein